MATTRKPAKPAKPLKFDEEPGKPGRQPGRPGKPGKPDEPPAHGGHADHEGGDEGGASITLAIRLGPMVSFQIEGRNCQEITRALRGFEQLNRTVDEMFSDLAKRVYPDLGHEKERP